ncbi:endonuclease/exonuclease/phosphatase family protein [Streptomyces durbertensis]|uniref:Endonuclease/exonuclease/phosphatase family protein n=1 Tax=Streptomyces durbertensis TaxID=2448886 RepID=A0ABR6EJB6_9ACTN|nr:endonuclease/exonuclease/phosphatase family protein [Streptomyces durbertensis]MBB1245436.1 endonuclease/exonuclease/phosphatase family protein [Streptomyces durbertensis]
MRTGSGRPPEHRTPDGSGTSRGARPARRGGARRTAATLSVLLLLVCTAPLVARIADTDGPTPLPYLLAFLPWLLVPGWLALFFAVLARRLLLVGWALAALGTIAWYLQPYGPSQTLPEAEPPAQIRVLTANLRHGQALDALLAALREERPHLVSVQECDAECARRLRGSTVRDEHPYQLFAGDGAAAGSAILSTYPLSARPRVPGTLAMPGAVVDVRGLPVRFQVAHPMPPEPFRLDTWRRELAALRTFAADRGDARTIIAGDFHATQDHAAFRAIVDTGMRDATRLVGRSRTATWPAPLAPRLGAQIDHVLVSRHLVPVTARFVPLEGSDHLAVLVELRVYE